jgi:MFS family permease
MDRFGRVPVLAVGFGLGIVGGLLTALGSAAESPAAVVPGLLGVGVAGGMALLARTAAGDMYPPARRARGIALVLVLFGAVFGAILGPAVFSPLLSGRDLDGDALAVPWIAAAGFMAVGLLLILLVRPDPKRIAELISPVLEETGGLRPVAAPLRELLQRPGVIPSLLAAVASFSVMVGVMTLTGYVVVEEHGHAGHTVFPIIGAHVFGMYALVLVVGDLIDRIDRTPSLAASRLWRSRSSACSGSRACPQLRSPSSASALAGTSPSSPPPPSWPIAQHLTNGEISSASTTCSRA